MKLKLILLLFFKASQALLLFPNSGAFFFPLSETTATNDDCLAEATRNDTRLINGHFLKNKSAFDDIEVGVPIKVCQRLGDFGNLWVLFEGVVVKTFQKTRILG